MHGGRDAHYFLGVVTSLVKLLDTHWEGRSDGDVFLYLEVAISFEMND